MQAGQNLSYIPLSADGLNAEPKLYEIVILV
jgi:hypothetical protein